MPFQITLTAQAGRQEKQFTRTIDALPADPKACSEQQLAAILDNILSLLEEAKQAMPKISYVPFSIMDESGEKDDNFDIYSYIGQCAEFETLHPKMLEYMNATYDEKNRDRYWDDPEHQAGTEGIKPLAIRDKKYIATYIEFLYTNDMDHEVAQCGDIAEIVNAHGWCPETLQLMVARATTCCGQHGYEDFLDNYNNNAPPGIAVAGLKDYILSHTDEFFTALKQENFPGPDDYDCDQFEWDSFSNEWIAAVYEDLEPADKEKFREMIQAAAPKD
jgi:hypothetical protein